jgi:hypothetical protein
MASAKKRTRRSAAATKTPRAATVRTATPPATTVPTTPTRASTAETSAPDDVPRPSSRRDAVDWSNEYSYVIGDLKQMAVISVALFAVMIAIGFFL